MTDLLGGTTILESSSSRNQDWVGAGGDPDTIDTDYYNQSGRNDLKHVPTFTTAPGWKTEINKDDFPGDFHTATPLGENGELIPFTGFFDTLADRNAFMEFTAQHNNIADEPVYLVVRHGASSYEQFADSSRAMQDYAKGYITDVRRPFDAEERQFLVTFIFNIVWD